MGPMSRSSTPLSGAAWPTFDAWYPRPGRSRRRWRLELEAALAHLRRVDERYWERDWRAEHKGLGGYPEGHLWRGAHGYLDLLHALASRRAEVDTRPNLREE